MLEKKLGLSGQRLPQFAYYKKKTSTTELGEARPLNT